MKELVKELLDHLGQVSYILDNWYDYHFQDPAADIDRAEIDKLFEVVSLLEKEVE